MSDSVTKRKGRKVKPAKERAPIVPMHLRKEGNRPELPEDRSYLSKIDPNECLQKADLQNTGRELTREEDLVTLVSLKNDQIIELKSEVSACRAREIERLKREAELLSEIATLRGKLAEHEDARAARESSSLNAEAKRLLNEFGVVPGMPICVRGGKKFWPGGGFAPEDLPGKVSDNGSGDGAPSE